MTTGLAILNRKGVALAADSAVTTTGPQGEELAPCTYGEEKIFRLVPGQPVALMLAGSSRLMDVAWRTIVSAYYGRIECHCHTGLHPSLSDFVEDFLSFAQDQRWFPPEEQRRWFDRQWEIFARKIVNDVAAQLGGDAEALRRKLNQEADKWQGAKFVENTSELDVDAAMDRLGKSMRDMLETMLPNNLRLPEDCIQLILRTATTTVYKHDVSKKNKSILLFAGYGGAEKFPSAYVHEIGGVVLGKLLRGPPTREVRISCEQHTDYLTIGRDNAITMFMNGIEKKTQRRVEELFESHVRERFQPSEQSEATRFDEYMEYAQGVFAAGIEEECYRKSWICQGPLRTAAVSELAQFARRLAQLEALDARYAYAEHSVGEPIDVATLSKQGFEWRKRKGPID